MHGLHAQFLNTIRAGVRFIPAHGATYETRSKMWPAGGVSRSRPAMDGLCLSARLTAGRPQAVLLEQLQHPGRAVVRQAERIGLVTAAFALSWLVGFLAPGAPAGLGVREGIMVVLLSGAADNAQLLVFVLLARLVTMLGDACNFLIGSAWLAVDQSKGNAIS